uniref:ARAD1D47498p n=1 Tax=Blastobotrys adeninivorans TaxID=409370 RepID=A0A060TDF6_BLAAD
MTNLTELPGELVQIISDYLVLLDDRLELRNVCRLFDDFLAPRLLGSVSIRPAGHGELSLWRNDCRHVISGTDPINVPFSPIDAHVSSLTVTVPFIFNVHEGKQDVEFHKQVFERLRVQMPNLNNVKIIYDLTEPELHSDMGYLVRTVLGYLPEGVRTEVGLLIFADLDSRWVSLDPADLTDLKDEIEIVPSPEPMEQLTMESWPDSIDEVWSELSSIEIEANIDAFIISEDNVINDHIYNLQNAIVPGRFLTHLFPRGFPTRLTKLQIISPLVINCTDILQSLRNCRHLKDLSLFAVFNLKSTLTENEYGLPSGLERLELFESGGTILPKTLQAVTACTTRLQSFKYTIVGDSLPSHFGVVSNFAIHSPLHQLELNAASSSDLEDLSSMCMARRLGFVLLKIMQNDDFAFKHSNGLTVKGRISYGVDASMHESIVHFAKSLTHVHK